MAQKQVRICDRCRVQKDYFATTDWTVVKISAPNLEGVERFTENDLCGKCTSALNSFLTNYAQPAEEIKR